MGSRFAARAALCALACLVATEALAKRKPKPATATLEVTSSVVGAAVLVDGKSIGETPLKPKSLKAGTSTVTVRKLGHLEFTERVELQAGQTTKLFADLLPFAGVLKVTADVPGAKVAVDGKPVGTAPLEHEVKVGNRVVTVSAPGYNAVTQNVRADPGSVYVLEAKLGSGGEAGTLALDGAAVLPLEMPRGSGGDGAVAELPLEDLGASGELALEAMPGLELLAPPRIAATDPNALPLEALSASVGPAKPWYNRWYTWTIAGAVVVAAATTTYVLTRGEDVRDTSMVGVWRPADDGAVGHYTASPP